MKNFISLIFLATMIVGCERTTPEGWIDKERLLNPEPKDWLSLGGNYKQQHYSPLNQIITEDVKDLGFAGDIHRADGNEGEAKSFYALANQLDPFRFPAEEEAFELHR